MSNDSPALPRWSALSLGHWRAWYALAGVAVMIGILGLLTVMGMASPAGQALQFALFALTAMALPWALSRRASAIDFGWRPARPGRATLIVALATALAIGGAELQEALDPTAAQAAKSVMRVLGLGQDAVSDVWMVLCIVSLAPVGEEMLFRGLLYRSLRDGMARRGWPLAGMLLGAALTSWMFAESHGGDGFDQQLVALGCFGALMVLAYELTGSIAVPIMVHSLNNTFAVLIGLQRDPSVQLSADGVYVLAACGPFITLLLIWVLAAIYPRGEATKNTQNPVKSADHPPC